MSRPIVREHNQETGEILEREMNDEEYGSHLDFVANQPPSYEEIQRINKEKEESKTALLNRLGITEDEAKLLLS